MIEKIKWFNEEIIDVTPNTPEGHEKARKEMDEEFQRHMDEHTIVITSW